MDVGGLSDTEAEFKTARVRVSCSRIKTLLKILILPYFVTAKINWSEKEYGNFQHSLFFFENSSKFAFSWNVTIFHTSDDDKLLLFTKLIDLADRWRFPETMHSLLRLLHLVQKKALLLLVKSMQFLFAIVSGDVFFMHISRIEHPLVGNIRKCTTIWSGSISICKLIGFN